MFDVPAPMPGRIPMPTPISAERKALGSWPRNSFIVKPKPRMPFITGVMIFILAFARPASATLMTSAIANMPTRTVNMEKPALSST